MSNEKTWGITEAMARNEKTREDAEALAKVWIVNAYKQLVRAMDNPDDVASSFEVAFIDGYLTGHRAALKSQVVRDLVEALRELVMLTEDVRTGDYTPDSFTIQPAAIALAKYREILGEK